MMLVTVDLSWRRSAEPDVAGYRIYWSGARHPERAVTVPSSVHTLCLAVSLRTKTVYTFAVTAFDAAGNESARTTLKAVYVAAAG